MNEMKSVSPAVETLDPEDFEAVRALGHMMLDDIMDQIESVRDRPAWQPIPDEVKGALDQPLPRAGMPLGEVYREFKDHILPYPTGNQHPGFFGWVMGNGTVTGMLADMLASGMNPHLAGYEQSAAIIERKVIEWLAESLGFPKSSSGLLVTGGTMANLNGLAVARQVKTSVDVRSQGNAADLVVYGSCETHNWIYKACELMGLGRDAFRSVPVKDDFSIDVEICRQMITEDLTRGLKPFCLIGTLGTVNTGAMDDIASLRQIADEFDLWLHIDGAFGSLAAWSPQAPVQALDQSKADSIAFDLHKWGYMPYDVGCVITRHDDAQEQTFQQSAGYLTNTARGPAHKTTYFADKGIQLSRSFRALKVWMSMKEQGLDQLGRLVQQNIEQARYLGGLVEDSSVLTLAAPVSLNIVCFGVREDLLGGRDLTEVNREVLLRIQESGVSLPSQAVIDGKFLIRACITNHRTRIDDLHTLIEAAEHHADAVLTGR